MDLVVPLLLLLIISARKRGRIESAEGIRRRRYLGNKKTNKTRAGKPVLVCKEDPRNKLNV
jgi:hypothetical protein